jgi:hypothetical protein
MKKSLYMIVAILIVLAGSTLVFSDATISKGKDGVQTVTITSDSTSSSVATKPGTTKPGASKSGYVLIGWNDLGMHCISPSFKDMAILPPYNNLMVQAIKKGNPPSILTSGVTIEYSLINNRTVAGKTDFWQYVKQLFGVAPPQGIGLTGNGLSGKMQAVGDHFEATGIPILPYDDSMVWDPYQRATVTMKNSSGAVIASTEVVIPVSDELNCGRCHSDSGVAANRIAKTGSVEKNILALHDLVHGTAFMGSQNPILCSSCHSDNALGLPGVTGIPSLSESMHGRHASVAAQPGCYDCHPGQKTNCNRSAIDGMGPVGTNPNCEKCHGSLQQVADSVTNGRVPWVQEPTCVQCHDKAFATQALYRNSRGHGGVYCAACHNSPHAWWPSKNAVDNVQPIKLQGSAGPIGTCTVCHTGSRSGDNPHKISGAN